MAIEGRELGGTGIVIPPVIMGCGNFGGVGSAPAFFGMGESVDEAMALLDRALDLGMTVLDTADAYGGGRSEETIGAWLAARPGTRDRVLLSSKVGQPVGDAQDRSGLSAAHIERQVDESLRRLGTDHLDMYLPHCDDPATPLEETLLAFDRLVVAGKVGAIGVSNHTPAAVARSLAISEELDVVRFEWVQNSLNLVDHPGEAETLAICAEHGLGVTPFSPLLGGLLTGKYDLEADYPSGSRMTLRPEPYLQYWTPAVFAAIDELAGIAADHGVSTAGMALAWVMGHPLVTAPIVGPRRPDHFAPVEEALAIDVEVGTLDHLGETFRRATSS
ncbi:MAG: aldo/keto reductase [Actinomycetota bacterium]